MAESQNRTLTEQFMLRLPDGMRDRIKAAAEANNRSMNAEIVARLETSFEPPRPSIDMRQANLFTLELMQALVRRFPTVTGQGLLDAMQEHQPKPPD